MRNAPSKHSATQLITKGWPAHKEVELNGIKQWVPGRSMGLHSIPSRFKLAWHVFTGKADALYWDGQ